MDIINRKVAGKWENYEIYTEQEADDKGITYKYWKESSEGNYGVSDDGYVGICLKRAEYTDKHNRKKTHIKMSYGVGWVSKGSKILYEPNKLMNIFTQVKPTHWADKEAKRTRTKQTVAAYVDMLISAHGIDWEALGNIYRPDEKAPAATVRRLMKQESIKTMVEEKTKEILAKKGITKERVLDLYEKGLLMAETKIDVGNFIKIADTYADLLEMKPGKKVVTDSIELDFSSKITDVIETEDKKLRLERKDEEG